VLNVAGITDDSYKNITNVTFLFGTGPDGSVSGPNNIILIPHAVPEPASIALAGMAVLGAAGYGWRRRQVA